MLTTNARGAARVLKSKQAPAWQQINSHNCEGAAALLNLIQRPSTPTHSHSQRSSAPTHSHMYAVLLGSRSCMPAQAATQAAGRCNIVLVWLLVCLTELLLVQHPWPLLTCSISSMYLTRRVSSSSGPTASRWLGSLHTYRATTQQQAVRINLPTASTRPMQSRSKDICCCRQYGQQTSQLEGCQGLRCL